MCTQICPLWLDCPRPLVSLVLAYERVCKEAVWHARSQGEMIEKRRQGCKNQPSHPGCPSWSLLHILPCFEAQLPVGFQYEPRGFGHFGLIFYQNLPFFENGVLVRIELRGAIVELARETKMLQGSWSCEQCVRFLTFMLTRPQSERLRTHRTCVCETHGPPKTSLLPASLYKVICPRERGIDERHRGGM